MGTDVLVRGDANLEPGNSQEDLASMTLDDLAALANEEHNRAAGALTEAIVHAIRAGEALLAARDRVPQGGWQSWLAENFEFSEPVAYKCMRFAYYQAYLRGSEKPIRTVRQAYETLNELPSIAGGKEAPDYLKAEAVRLWGEGVSKMEISRMLDVSDSSVREWIDPQARQRRIASTYRRRVREKAARRALKEKERKEAAKKAGGSVSDAYSLLRRAAAALDSAHQNEEDPEAARALRQALDGVYKAEDNVSKALRVP